MKPDFARITRKASKTFYAASLLFPKEIREDVFVLYTFLRRADDMIDHIPPQIQEYHDYKKMTYEAIAGRPISDEGLLAMGALYREKKLSRQYIDDFFRSLELDLKTHLYKTFDDLQEFTYGVAEVVGLLMSQVMNLPQKAYPAARSMGLAMQLVNIIRDIDEDHKNNRVYIPQEDLKRFGLPSQLTEEIINRYPDQYVGLIRYELRRALHLISEGRKGFQEIPHGYQLPIRISADIYTYYCSVFYKNPFIIFKKKFKPSYLTILYFIIKNSIFIHGRRNTIV